MRKFSNIPRNNTMLFFSLLQKLGQNPGIIQRLGKKQRISYSLIEHLFDKAKT